jgi:hypothetical protein
MPVFKTGAINHSATSPTGSSYSSGLHDKKNLRAADVVEAAQVATRGSPARNYILRIRKQEASELRPSFLGLSSTT